MKKAPLKNNLSETYWFTRRVLIIGIIISLMMIFIIGRLIQLQVLQKQHFTTLSAKNQLDLLPIVPNRGLIYDRNGVLLAENIPVYSLEVLPEHTTNLHDNVAAMTKLIHITPNNLRKFHKALKRRRPSEAVVLRLKLTKEEAAMFYVNQHRFPGFSINSHMIRHYPKKEIMTHSLGYVGRVNEKDLKDPTYANFNYIGKTGIEKYYEAALRGTLGYEQVESDARGRIIRTIKKTNPIAGNNLYLTIDSKLQEIAQKALADERGAVVAIEPSTGDVLAMVSNPSFDPNAFVTGINTEDYQKLQKTPGNPLYNRSVRGQYAPGSTLKPFISLDAIDKKYISPYTKIFDDGTYMVPGSHHVFRDWLETGHGFVDVTKAIIVSCDTYFYNLTEKMGIKAIDSILQKFGFGVHTGIDLNNEHIGLLASPVQKRRQTNTSWYKGDTVNSIIGQGFMLTTPLQLAFATATMANRGEIHPPHLVHHIELGNAQPDILITTPTSRFSLDNPKNWDIIINAMQKVITSTKPAGTGFRFGRHPGYTVAAKTGTAQVFRDKSGKRHHNQLALVKKLRDNGFFIAFAPVKDPKIAIAVVVEHNIPLGPTIARKIFDQYLKHGHEHNSEKTNIH